MKQNWIKLTVIFLAVAGTAAITWMFAAWNNTSNIGDIGRPKDITINKDGEKMTSLSSKVLHNHPVKSAKPYFMGVFELGGVLISNYRLCR